MRSMRSMFNRFAQPMLAPVCVLAGLAVGPAAAQGPDADADALQQFELRRRDRIALLPPAPPVPTTDLPGFNEVDAFIIAAWESANLPESFVPPDVCDDATFLRRVHLDLVGAIPTIAETNAFLADTSANKRSRLIDALLARDQEYADHWTAFWEDALASSIVAVNGGMATRGNSTRWINDAFRTNRPFDLFAAQLLDPSLPGHYPVQMGSDNGRPVRAHFVLNQSHTDTLQTAAAVAQVFMGTAMKCAACHNHFENDEWPQRRFLSFASMFSASDLEVIRCESPTGSIAPAAFPFHVPGMPEHMPDTEADRRRLAGQLLVDPLNPRFARTIVNRLWKRFLGLGLFEPADDFRDDVAPTHPELLDWLADDLIRHDFDLKRTIRLMLNSRTYQLRHEPALADAFDVGHPHAMRWFRSPTLRRLTAEQFLDSVQLALRQQLPSASRAYRRTESTPLTRALSKPAIRNDISTARSDEPAILQALELLNGEEYQRTIASGRVLQQAMSTTSARDAADHLVRAVLSRPATTHEQQALASYLSSSWSARETSQPPREHVWIDGDLPEGATTQGEWRWIDEPTAAERARSHAQGGNTSPRVQHLFYVSPGWPVGADDVLFVEAFIDPANPPRQIMLQWNDGGSNDGGWAHRAYWGENLIAFGIDDTVSRRSMGALPEAGRWMRLDVPARDVGLGENASRVVGMSFDQAGGAVQWGRAGVVSVPATPLHDDLHDVLWALFTSAEFQYIK